ncbi:glycoside hydrolase family 16 protein [Aulographum hederae CBS 113979]|uniref:Glycoside hydrolase family 16 protein n=1 Tax=Aulographum hederae CBS 113979 TaxID=1176131 RepID=A0A6G1HHM3_9PEZI|nr:glycoside hydrolase family 16 protein [Aulographum hederae CBS 113979]
MAPLRKAALRGPTGSPGPDEFNSLQQAGRSASNLYAEAASVAFREPRSPASPPSLNPSSSTPNLVNQKSNSRSAPSLRRPPSAPQIQHLSSSSRQAYAPPISSPLNPLSPSESTRPSYEDTSDELQATSSGSSGESSGARNGRSPSGFLKPVAPPPPPPRRQSRMPRTPGFEEIQERGESPGRREGTPISVRDLGSDYTRYFSPFGDSRRSSYVDVSKNNASTVTMPVYAGPMFAQSSPNVLQQTPMASTARLLNGTDSEKAFSQYLDDRLAAPYTENGQYAFPMFIDEKEDDDEMHMPHPDDDVVYKAKARDHFTRENICSTIGLFFLLGGLIFLFVVFPVLTYTGLINFDYAYDTPLEDMPNKLPEAEPWATVNNKTYPLMQNVRRGLIDPDTPNSAKTRKSWDGSDMKLVFSDEFNDDGRTFYSGDDPYWFAPDIWYGATIDLDWYDPDAATTRGGVLNLQLDAFPNHGLNYRSGMLNSWNQLCFKGGVFEVSVSLPGPPGIMGYWPGAWTMGNLGRPGYLATTEGMWPYTYNDCDAGITPNQSMTDGTSRLPGQRLTSCSCPNEDHPTPGTGRGAPEIDILEASASYQVKGAPVITQSYQVAPFDIWYYPDYNFTAFPDFETSFTNTYTGGPFQQAVSATTMLNKDWFDGKQYQKYAFEYQPGSNEDGSIQWFVGDQMVFHLDGRAIGANGNVGPRQISQEPMAMVLNLGFSHNWVQIDFANLRFPAVMRVDYVRWYQKEGQEMVTCDPPGYETTQYIEDHLVAYTNPNLTSWDQTGFHWPKNSLTTDC